MKKLFSFNSKLLFTMMVLSTLIINASMAAEPTFTVGKEMCDMIKELQDVFKILRTLAFLGAAFILAKYGWEAISTGKVGGKDLIEGVKTTGISMIVGFALLFVIGVILSVLIDGRITGCPELTQGWI